ncbi:MAG: helix-turn-helix domain-containing protein [Streptosporangiaceae bacterium]
MDERDIYQTDEVAVWLRELQDSDPKTAGLVDDAIYTLSRSGPALGRPLVGTITNSKIANRQSGQRLAEERKQRGLTQAQLAETMGVTPGRVSQIERGELSTIEAIARYVQALGGHLELVANFADHTLTVTTTEAACQQASGAPPQADQMARDRGLHQFSDSERVLARHNLYRRDIAALSSASG